MKSSIKIKIKFTHNFIFLHLHFETSAPKTTINVFSSYTVFEKLPEKSHFSTSIPKMISWQFSNSLFFLLIHFLIHNNSSWQSIICLNQKQHSVLKSLKKSHYKHLNFCVINCLRILSIFAAKIQMEMSSTFPLLRKRNFPQ